MSSWEEGRREAEGTTRANMALCDHGDQKIYGQKRRNLPTRRTHFSDCKNAHIYLSLVIAAIPLMEVLVRGDSSGTGPSSIIPAPNALAGKHPSRYQTVEDAGVC